jgi:glycosyltransferase involved in cell wall biosynthesis
MKDAQTAPSDRSALRIALLGSRGIPATYSGFETFYEQLATRLSERGHQVTVYNRSYHFDERHREYKGVRTVFLPSIPSKHLDTLSHSFLSLLHAIFSGHDIFYMVIVGNSPLVVLAHLFGKKVILNVDGADSDREKWKGFAKTYLRWSERIAARFADFIIADSTVIAKRYQSLYQRDTIFIPYGANPWPRENEADNRTVLDRFGIESGRYLLFVSRMTPENCAHILIEAYQRSGSKRQLVIVGDAPYVDDYKKQVRSMAGRNANIIMTGYLFGADYRQISSHCSFFVLPAGIDGTRPVLLDQMAFGNCVVVRNTAANLEVIGDAGIPFSSEDDVNSLADVIRGLESDDLMIETMRRRALERVESVYSWERVTDQYEALFESTAGQPT